MKKKFNILLLFILVNIPFLAWAVTAGPYYGRVVDGQTGEPVVGASVLIFWEKNTPYPRVIRPELMNVKPVYSALLDVKMVYSDDSGNYTIPQVTDSDREGNLTRSTIIVYQPGYEAEIKTITNETSHSERQQDFKTTGNIIKLQRIPPKFDHRKHRESIHDALTRLEDESERLDKDPLTGEPIEVSKRVQELIENIPKIRQELLVRTKWEERRYSTYNMTVAIHEFCGIQDFYIAPGKRELKPEFLVQYVQCTESILQELKHKDPWRQLDAVYKLGAIRARKTIPVLLDLLKDISDWRHKYVQQECVLSIGEAALEHRNKSKMTGMMMQAHGTVSIEVEPTDSDEITKRDEMREKIISAFLQKAGDPYLRKGIIRALGWFHARKAENIVKDAMQDPDEEIRAIAVISYSLITNASDKIEEHPPTRQTLSPAPTPASMHAPIPALK
jgi:hypothetical protein